ncbi:hypothetical protein CISIN_1g0218812mg, partial [Citrus sinensis]
KIGFSGLWFGLLSAQAACAVSILYVVLVRTDWEAEAMKAMKLTSLEISTFNAGAGDTNEEEEEEESKGLLLYGICFRLLDAFFSGWGI